MDYKAQIIDMIKDATGKELDENQVEIPPDKTLGDFALPCFLLSRELKKSPVQIAAELKAKMESGDSFARIEANGPYLNFFVEQQDLVKKIIDAISSKGDSFGCSNKTGKTIVIESPGPNTNKPLHLGHVRNMVLGNALCSIYDASGYDVKRVDIVNDRGVHICKSMLAYMKWGEGKEPDKKPDHFVGDFYVKYAQEAQIHPELEDEIRDMLIKWEQGDEEIRAVWKKMGDWALEGFRETYRRFGVKMDKAYKESDHYKKGKKIVMEGLEKGLFSRDDDGNVIVDLEKEGLGKKVILRADGTSIYITQDMILAKLRYDDYKMDKMIYVVGNEQKYHFQVLFRIFEMLGYPFAKGCYHLAYGMIYLPEGKMKSREGKVVDADNMADDMHALAKAAILGRHPDIDTKEADKRAESIAMSAIKFFILKYDPMKDFIYNPEESLSFEGETGPYVQYTHARICSILRKAGADDDIKDADLRLLSNDEEKELAKSMAEYPEMIQKCVRENKPSLLCRYLLDLSQLLNNYYHKHQVIQDDKDLEKARLALLQAARIVLSNGLVILGIDALEEM